MKNDLTAEERLNQILAIAHNLFFTSANLTGRQKELLSEIKEIARGADEK